jgi:hypothetical protein
MSSITDLSIHDPWVQEFLWKYLNPTDIRYDYTKLDAIKYIQESCLSGDTKLIGNKDYGVVIRCVSPNPLVVEPHIMGNGLYFRKAVRDAIPYAWHWGASRIVVWTQYKAIYNILSKSGFRLDAVVPEYILQGNELIDIHVLSLDKDEYYSTVLAA